jgi:hypothetical protein
MTSILLPLYVFPVKLDDDCQSSVRCVSCTDPLVLHQPDEACPDRLLGTCPECGVWFLIDRAQDFMLQLPTKHTLRNRIRRASQRRGRDTSVHVPLRANAD